MAGFFYVRMQTPVYQRQTCVMLNNESSSGGELSVLADLVGSGTRKRIDNEIFILKSIPMMEKVVDELGLNTRYWHYLMPVADRVRVGHGLFSVKRVEYYRNSPFSHSFNVDSLYPKEQQPYQFNVEIRNHGDKGFTVRKIVLNGKKQKLRNTTFKYGDIIPLDGGSFSINMGEPSEMIKHDRYVCSWNKPYNTAKGFIKNLSTEIQSPMKSRLSDVVVSFKDNIASRAVDILDMLIAKVNEEARSYGNATTINTIDFIDSRLLSIARDLSDAENNYKYFQTSNIVVDLNTQSQVSIESDLQYRNQLNEVVLQLQLLDMVTDYINDSDPGKYAVIPSYIGVSDVGLNGIISNYNQIVAERNRMLANSSESNPRVQSISTQLDDLKKSIEISIANLVKMYTIRQKELSKILTKSKSQMANIPQQQFELQQLNRRLEIIEPLYLLLQQKREEAQLQIYSQMDNFRVIESANGESFPVSPKSMQIYLLSLLLGFCIPLLAVWLRMKLRTTVETKKDETDHVDASILAVLPHCEDGESNLIQRSGRDAVSEAFRSIRTNLQYLYGAKVIQVTSSIPGEGKTFIASNLALSIAHVGKKVLVVGMDIRKPRLSEVFPSSNVDKYDTVVGYLIGRCQNLEQLVHKTEKSSCLDIIYPGPVPPNPTELLSQGKQVEIIDYFRERYDYIIIDSAPFLPVSDSLLVNSMVDATIYTIRVNKTPLAMLDDIDEAIKSTSRPLKRVNLVLNDFDGSASKYRYGYGYGYGESGGEKGNKE